MPSSSISKVAVIGAGSWGTVVANAVASNLSKVAIWARDAEVVRSINQTGVNQRFLPGLKLSEHICATTDVREALAHAQLVLWAIPVQYTRERLREFAGFVPPGAVMINLSKGLEGGSWYRPSQIMAQECSGLKAIGSLGGPNIASEIAAGKSAVATLAITNHWEVQGIEGILSSESFHVNLSPDLTALELAGALKNVVAIGAGICDGLRSGENTKATVIAAGFEEMRLIGRALGANPDSFNSSFGLGDLIATCCAAGSRNRSLGQSIGSGLSLSDAVVNLNGRVAEGIATAKACCGLAKKLGFPLPLIDIIEDVLEGRLPPGDLVQRTRGVSVG